MKRMYLFLLFLCTLGAGFLLDADKTYAVTAADWRPGRIIDDVVFQNKNSMSVAQIQQFLDSKVPTCDRWGTKPMWAGGPSRAQWSADNGRDLAPYTCLKEYVENPTTKANNASDPTIVVSGGLSAAQLIFNASQAQNVNPQVFLVLLQKEQSLVTDDWPYAKQFERATGNNCPDTAPCNPAYAWLSTQVTNAGAQFNYYVNNFDQYNYAPGWNNILYQANAPSCGTRRVFIENRFTAALYIYTPYTPNQAALDNMYGTGDSCSAYGNRNFWRLFNDWFGTSVTSARIVMMPIDPTSDENGKSAIIKIRLNQPISSPVTIPLQLSASAPGVFATPTSITIDPLYWNDPDKNVVVIRGQGTGSGQGTERYQLITGNPSTNDPNFRLLTGEYVDDVNLTHLSTNDTAVYRLFNSSTGTHVYTGSQVEKQDLVDDGYIQEGTAFYYCRAGETPIYRFRKGSSLSRMSNQEGPTVAQAIAEGYNYDYPLFSSSRGASVPVFELWSPSGNAFYTTSSSEKDIAVSVHGYTYKGVAFYGCGQNQKPIYRLYSSAKNNHLFTASPVERDIAASSNYRREGVGFYDCEAPTAPVYRMYSTVNKKHFYTTSSNEKDYSISVGYSYEGEYTIACSGTQGTDIHRLYNPTTQKHFFTPSLSEKQYLMLVGFIDEGVLYNSGP